MCASCVYSSVLLARDKDVLLARVRQYVSAVVTARVSEAAVDYDEHSLLREARRLEQQYGGRSLGNTSLDKFKDMYTERAVDGTDEYCGTCLRACLCHSFSARLL